MDGLELVAPRRERDPRVQWLAGVLDAAGAGAGELVTGLCEPACDATAPWAASGVLVLDVEPEAVAVASTRS